VGGRTRWWRTSGRRLVARRAGSGRDNFPMFEREDIPCSNVGIGFCATSVGVWSSTWKLINFRQLVLLSTEI
jgi:hypothetical protein